MRKKKASNKNYQCHHEPCTACGEFYLQRCYHHVVTQRRGGSDGEHNLMPLCARHHSEVHSCGLRRFSERHGNVQAWLTRKGWSFNEALQAWNNPSEHGGAKENLRTG